MSGRTRNVIHSAEATGTVWGLLLSALVRAGVRVRGIFSRRIN